MTDQLQNKLEIQSQRKNTKKCIDTCAINSAERNELRKQIMFLEEKYEKIKKKMHQKKILGQLTDQDVQEIGNLINIIAMKYSQDGQNNVAEEWLRRALKYGEVSERVRIVTFNNMACVYKQANDLPLALLYINKAQRQADYFCLEMQDDKLIKVVTDCSLNLCAILSAMGDHYKALKAARKALALLKSNQDLPNSYFHSLFPIIKYNEAVQLERLKMYEDAEAAYLQAKNSASVTPQLSQRLRKAIEQVGILKQKTKNKNKSISKRGKRIRLSLPKFGAQDIKQSESNGQNHRHKSQPKWSEKQKNTRQIQGLGKITIQNYHSAKSSGRTILRTRQNVLASVQNF